MSPNKPAKAPLIVSARKLQTAAVRPESDSRLMMARATICTLTVDREGEMIVPLGVKTENYRRNPVVLWDHGMGSVTFPLGKSRRPDGSLAIEIWPDRIDAECYFTSSTRESEQAFHLVDEGIINATSIHVMPAARAKQRGPDGDVITVIPESEMIEWSWGCVGVNPEAVAKTLARGRLAGSQILPAIKTMLAPYAPQRTATCHGADIGGESDASRIARLESKLNEVDRRIKRLSGT